MAEVIFKVEVPAELRDVFEERLKMLIDRFIEALEFSIATKILSKSELTEEQANELADEVKEAVAKRHGLT